MDKRIIVYINLFIEKVALRCSLFLYPNCRQILLSPGNQTTICQQVSTINMYSPADFWVACATRESPISYFFGCFFFFACLFSSSFLNFLRAHLSCKSMAVNIRIGAKTKCNHINDGIVAKVIT